MKMNQEMVITLLKDLRQQLESAKDVGCQPFNIRNDYRNWVFGSCYGLIAAGYDPKEYQVKAYNLIDDFINQMK